MEQQSCAWSDLKVSPHELHFEVVEDWQFIPPYQYLRVENEVSYHRSPRWDAEGNQDWIRISPQSGTTPKNVRIGCSSIGKPAGIYHGMIRISSHVKVTPSDIPITLTVKPKEVPEPDPEPEPEPEPEPIPDPDPDPIPDPDPDPIPEPEPEPEPEPPEHEDDNDIWYWFKRFIDWILSLFGK